MSLEFGTWLDRLREKRQRWVDASHENDFDRGIWNATVEKYADPTHFIFELLQNAEDAGATSASFRLTSQSIVFEHNGRPFDRNDIEGITGIGNTTKLEEANKIGCFGIGFKSVYVVTERPEVHCTIEDVPIAFGIRDLVVPELIATSHRLATTQIILPLALGEAPTVIGKARAALDISGSRSLLFLNNLKSLSWTDGTTDARCVVEDTSDGVRIIRTTAGATAPVGDRFLVLSRPVARKGDVRAYSVKIAMRLNDGGEIVPESSPTRVAVFFETEDVTGLHFQVHGPFQLTDNRANIKRDDSWNTKLITELTTLLTQSLPDLRDQGMIKRSFLEVMPNGNDALPEPWQPMLAAIIDTFQTQALLPAHSGGHVAGQSSVRGPSDVRELLGDDGLGIFGGLPNRRWVSMGMRSSRIDAFLSTLKLTEWGHAELLAAFQRAFGISWYDAEKAQRAKAQGWFDALTDEQVQRLYLLVDASLRTHKGAGALSSLSFVRLQGGGRGSPSDALLPPDDATLDEEASAHGLVLVKPELTRTGRARGKEVLQFLRKVGVKEISERNYLAAIIGGNYARGCKPPTAERHLQHMRRFLRWYADSGDARIFAGVGFLRVEGADGYHQAGAVYLGAPHAQNALSRIYDGRVPGRDRLPLWSGYSKLKRQDLLSLMKAVGIEDSLTVSHTAVPYTHPKRSALVHGFGGARVTSTGTDSDYSIPQLPALLALRDLEVTKMVWKAVAAIGAPSMHAHYAPNQQYHDHRELSSLALILQAAEWIPGKDGVFRQPKEMTSALLPAGFSVKGNEAWLNIIGFGAEQRQRSEQHQARRQAAQTIGLPPELADELSLLSPEALATLATEMRAQIARGAFTVTEFPEREAPNPERRAERLTERARQAPVKAYEVRSRSVRTTDREARQLARPYLRDLYTNPAGDMVCQACHQGMPFRLADGSHYFEAPELLQSASSELAENHLALCPTCCAKWQHANSAEDAEIMATIRSAEIPELIVDLAGEQIRVRFVQTHFDDLRTILSVVDAASMP